VKLLWLRHFDLPVATIAVGPAGDVTVDLADASRLRLDVDGFRHDPDASRAGTGHRPCPAVQAHYRGHRLELRHDGTVVDEQLMSGAVRWTSADADAVTVLTADGDLSRWRTDAPVATLARLTAAEVDWLAGAADQRPVHPGRALLGAGFAVRRLSGLHAAGILTGAERDNALVRLGQACGDGPLAAGEFLALADALCRTGKLRDALPRYQAAARDPGLRAAALRGAARCLAVLDAPRAAELAYARLADLQSLELDPAAVRSAVRALSASGRPRSVQLGNELLLATDPDATDPAATDPAAADPAAADPAATDAGAGSAGLSTQLTAVQALQEQGLLPSESGASGFHAGWYHSFDHASAADTAKKTLEMVNVFGHLGDRPVARMRTLDIGSGTLRYPQALARLGACSVGIDLESSGVVGLPADVRRRFVQADGTMLPFGPNTFDLITCAMGTVNHLSARQRGELFAEARRTLVPGGQLAVTAWDPRSLAQDFLAMYSAGDRAALRSGLITREELAGEARAAGLEGIDVSPFAVFPDAVATAISLGVDGQVWIALLAALDEAARVSAGAHGGDAVGQLFLLFARKSEFCQLR